jgi:hypothetical protein
MGGCQCSNANQENNLNVPNEEDNKEEKKEEDKIEENKEEEKNNETNNLNLNTNNNQNEKILSIVKEESKEKSSNVNESNLNQNDLKLKSNNQKIKYKIENYPNDALNIINKIRNNPIEFIPEIEEAIKHIKTEQNKLIYSGNLKVALNKGEEIFKETIEILKQIPPMESLIFDNNIAIEPPDDEESFKDPKIFQNKIIEKKKNINLDAYFKDAIKDPFVSVLLIIVDDSGKHAGKKRAAVLNKDYKKIAITVKMINKKFCAYYTLSK